MAISQLWLRDVETFFGFRDFSVFLRQRLIYYRHHELRAVGLPIWRTSAASSFGHSEHVPPAFMERRNHSSELVISKLFLVFKILTYFCVRCWWCNFDITNSELRNCRNVKLLPQVVWVIVNMLHPLLWNGDITALSSWCRNFFWISRF